MFSVGAFPLSTATWSDIEAVQTDLFIYFTTNVCVHVHAPLCFKNKRIFPDFFKFLIYFLKQLWLKNTSVVLLSLQIGEPILNMLTVGTLSMCHDINRWVAVVSATT